MLPELIRLCEFGWVFLVGSGIWSYLLPWIWRAANPVGSVRILLCVPKFDWAIAEAMQFEFGHERKSIVSFILELASTLFVLSRLFKSCL